MSGRWGCRPLGAWVIECCNTRNAAPQAPVPPSLRSLVDRRAARRLEQLHSGGKSRGRLWALSFISFGTNDLYILLSQNERRNRRPARTVVSDGQTLNP